MLSSLFNIIKSIDESNKIQSNTNAFKAAISGNPTEKELAEARRYCTNKLANRRFKPFIFGIFVPILLLILFLIIGVSNSTVYVGLGGWFVCGIFYNIIMNIGDTEKNWKINNFNVTKEDCGF